MKDNKGITSTKLIIMVVIVAAILAAIIILSTKVANTTIFENIETDLLLIQSKAKVLADKKEMGEIDESELYGTKQEDGEYKDWYLLSQEELDEMGIKKAKAEDKYYVNYENNDVAYGSGIDYKGTTYYKLSEMKEIDQADEQLDEEKENDKPSEEVIKDNEPMGEEEKIKDNEPMGEEEEIEDNELMGDEEEKVEEAPDDAVIEY